MCARRRSPLRSASAGHARVRTLGCSYPEKRSMKLCCLLSGFACNAITCASFAGFSRGAPCVRASSAEIVGSKSSGRRGKIGRAFAHLAKACVLIQDIRILLPVLSLVCYRCPVLRIEHLAAQANTTSTRQGTRTPISTAPRLALDASCRLVTSAALAHRVAWTRKLFRYC